MSSVMRVIRYLKAKLERFHQHATDSHRSFAILTIALATAGVSLSFAEAAVHVEALNHARDAGQVADLGSGAAPAPLAPRDRLVGEGADLDGDGQPDIANPTGRAPRQVDAYGEGCFHASRDGGEREHEGVDYVATAGQTVTAPISGYVAKIGYAYPDDQTLRYVEIDNPALRLTARVFYVDPGVEVGEAVAVGRPIGHAHSLQRRYPLGITNHVHLEIAERGRKVDAARLITARLEPDRRLAE
jgi:murein DD-endopeptidase MepM/ murein hydrolase activator NlpD